MRSQQQHVDNIPEKQQCAATNDACTEPEPVSFSTSIPHLPLSAYQDGDGHIDEDVIMQGMEDYGKNNTGYTRKRKHTEEFLDQETSAEETQTAKRSTQVMSRVYSRKQDEGPFVFGTTPRTHILHHQYVHSTQTTTRANAETASNDMTDNDGHQDQSHSLHAVHRTGAICRDAELSLAQNHIRPYQCNPTRYFRELIAQSIRQTSPIRACDKA